MSISKIYQTEYSTLAKIMYKLNMKTIKQYRQLNKETKVWLKQKLKNLVSQKVP